MKNEGLMTPCERFAEFATGKTRGAKDHPETLRERPRAASETAARSGTPLAGGAGPEACGNEVFRGNDAGRRLFSGLAFSGKSAIIRPWQRSTG